MKELFKSHLDTRLEQTYKILVENSVDNLIIESGFPTYYFLDDQPTVFRPNPYFQFYCPDAGQGHILVLSPGQKPKLFFYIPKDIWHETSSLSEGFWEDYFDIEIISNHDNLLDKLNLKGNTLHLGPQTSSLNKGEYKPLSKNIISLLDWIRSSKTTYEIECVRLANKKAAPGHLAAKNAFLEGKSELSIYEEYLRASKQREADLPYGAIIGLNEKAAVLHYQNLRTSVAGNSFLIDAGAKFNGYCSDVTRTYFTETAHPVFKELCNKITALELKLCELVQPNESYIKIHEVTMDGVNQIACDLDILTCDINVAKENNLSDFFFPHGVGHPLGLQVHDVGGRQTDARGSVGKRNHKYPFLRTLRDIHKNDVLTIEPGFYFIPKHLESAKKDSLKTLFNWKLIVELMPFGGVRIEDNIVATPSGPVNLTREFI